MSLKIEGREIDSFNVSGTRLIQDCASVGATIVRKLLTCDEHELNPVEPPTEGNAQLETETGSLGLSRPTFTETVPVPLGGNEAMSWESIRQEVIPLYVDNISFTVFERDLNSDRQKELQSRFPGVTIRTDRELFTIDDDDNEEDHLRRQLASEAATVISPTNADTRFPSFNTSITTAAETVPVTPSCIAMPKPTLLSRMSTGGSDIRIKGVASGDLEETKIPTGPRNLDNEAPQKTHSPILSVAQRIGLEISRPRDKVIHAMWIQWRNAQEVRPWGPRVLKLEQYYNNLVTLYILAYHKKELDLCFAILVRFQNTNYCFMGTLPEVPTAVLAFQYLPEEDDLCRWLSMLYSFLWAMQQYENHEHLLTELDGLDRNALSKLLFTVAHTRDPFTKGNNAAVLDRWCDVHHHGEGSKEEALCKEMYESMRANPDELRDIERDRRYQEAKDIIIDYNAKSWTNPQERTLTQSTPLAKGKRKAESPAAHSHKKYKRGGGRGGRGGYGIAS